MFVIYALITIVNLYFFIDYLEYLVPFINKIYKYKNNNKVLSIDVDCISETSTEIESNDSDYINSESDYINSESDDEKEEEFNESILIENVE